MGAQLNQGVSAARSWEISDDNVDGLKIGVGEDTVLRSGLCVSEWWPPGMCWLRWKLMKMCAAERSRERPRLHRHESSNSQR